MFSTFRYSSWCPHPMLKFWLGALSAPRLFVVLRRGYLSDIQKHPGGTTTEINPSPIVISKIPRGAITEKEEKKTSSYLISTATVSKTIKRVWDIHLSRTHVTIPDDFR